MCNTLNLHGNCLLWIASLGAPLLYQPLIREIKSARSQNRLWPKSQPTLSSFLVQSLVSLALQGHQGEVNALPLQQFVVLPSLHGLAVFKADNHVRILYGRQSVSDRYGGATHAYLPWQGTKLNPSLFKLFPTFRTLSGLTKAFQDNHLNCERTLSWWQMIAEVQVAAKGIAAVIRTWLRWTVSIDVTLTVCGRGSLLFFN